MIAIMRDKDAHVQNRQLAIWALQEMMPVAKSAVPALVATLKEAYASSHSLASRVENALLAAREDGDSAVPELLLLLKEKNVDRYAVIRLLANIGPRAEAAIPALRECLKDRNPAIVQAAEYALGRIDRKMK
jgi:HEAT repeat protein